MQCIVKEESVPLEKDIQQLHRFAITPAVETACEARDDTRINWKKDIGLVLESKADNQGAVRFSPPFLLVSAERTRALSISITSKRDVSLSLSWRGEKCSEYSEECRHDFVARKGKHVEIPLAIDSRETGHITELDLAFTGASSITLHKVWVPDETRPMNSQPPRHLFRGRNGVVRFEDGGRRGWNLPTGSALECRFPEKRPNIANAPQVIAFRVPDNDASVQFFKLQANWTKTGSTEAAAEYSGSFVNEEREGWIEVPLTAPRTTPEGLTVSLVCDKNCHSVGEDELSLEVAQPMYEYVVDKTTPAPKNVVLIVLDTLRADRLKMYNTNADTAPFLESWSENAFLYERFISGDVWTLPAHAAMFTGIYPLQYLQGNYAELPLSERTIAEELAARGYHTRAIADSCLLNFKSKLDQGFDQFINAYEPIDHKVERALSQLAELEKSDTPFFLFFHSYEIHSPYSYSSDDWDNVPSGTVPSPSHRPNDRKNFAVGENSTTDWLAQGRTEQKIEFLLSTYDSGIAKADAALKRLIERIENSSLGQDTVIVITSDHGEEFMEHGRIGHKPLLPYLELVHIPLLVKIPGQQDSVRISRLTSQTSLPDIIFDAMGTSPPPKQMRALIDKPWVLSVENAKTDPRHYRAAIFQDDLQLIITCNIPARRAVTEEVFRIDQSRPDVADRYHRLDESEVETRAAEIDQMRELLIEQLFTAYRKGTKPSSRPSYNNKKSSTRGHKDSLEIRQLRALGYME